MSTSFKSILAGTVHIWVSSKVGSEEPRLRWSCPRRLYHSATASSLRIVGRLSSPALESRACSSLDTENAAYKWQTDLNFAHASSIDRSDKGTSILGSPLDLATCVRS